MTAADVKVRPDQLAGLAELAEMFGVARSVVSNWRDRRDRNGFPAPLTTLAAGPVWDREAVRAWWLQYSPRRGRVGSLDG